MAIHKPMYSHRVYFETIEEYEAARVMAFNDGMGKSVSGWIRLLVVKEMEKRGMGTAAIPYAHRATTIEPDPNWENKLVPDPVTGELKLAKDIVFSTDLTDDDNFTMGDIIRQMDEEANKEKD